MLKTSLLALNAEHREINLFPHWLSYIVLAAAIQPAEEDAISSLTQHSTLHASVLARLARCAHGFHNVMVVMGVTNHFLIGSEACYIGGTTCLVL